MLETRDGYTITDSRDNIDWLFIIRSLQSTYWAEGRPEELIRKSFDNSVVLSLFHGTDQVGFARIVSDYACFAWLCDVYISPDHRGRGLGKFLMSAVAGHESTQVRMTILATKDAHGLYAKYGFERREMMFLKKEYDTLL
ncbi:GNAT family N-acetyltransferase [Spirochaeta isovalerica]|uniref:GNAT superfamily N-acetyltransferase n=1 Tax=Spirochaeta isovalerica TaxID=150 RepID=A0A841RAJ8_9SPIO|nr:GNAT family N-acetyltransferase [Spirochaeta isovalerica]MBB6480391.1 GNAT superfamily N-acetyltransferase [Spirochaeta isovalerica]